ncbi:hypothetical protein [Bosea sp. (in: a-proteobacteria)]
MAESQVPFAYTAADLAALRAGLSEDRFATYLTLARGNQAHAFDLYLYNARLAKAFLYPLSVAEITLRNAIDDLLVGQYGAAWHTAPGLRAILTVESERSLDKAIERTRRAHPALPRGQVVATLSFDFWSNLFRPEYDRPLWQRHLHAVLPHCPPGHTRPNVQALVRDINRLRNRIAHHEPILKLDVSALHADIRNLIGYRCPAAAAWVRHYSTIGAVMRTRPRAGAGHRFVDRCDARFQPVRAEQSLHDVMQAYRAAAPAIVCLDPAGGAIALFCASDIVAFAAARAAEVEGLVSFAEHTVADLIGSGLVGLWEAMDGDEPVARMVARFTDALDLRGIVATQTVAGAVVVRGAVLRAHRRY